MPAPHHVPSAWAQVEALDADGGDEEMFISNDRPSKRHRSGGATSMTVPRQHRGGDIPAAAAVTDSPASKGSPAGRADGRRSKSGPSAGVREGWRQFAADLAVAERAAAAAEGGFAFAFVEGALVKAVREGHWLLLDEVSPCARLQLDS